MKKRCESVMRSLSDLLENQGPGKMERDQRDNGKDARMVKEESLWRSAVELFGPVPKAGAKRNE